MNNDAFRIAAHRRRAAEIRTIADGIRDDPKYRDTLLRMADSYERMAGLIEASKRPEMFNGVTVH